METPKHVAFNAGAGTSYFPTDNGDGSYIINGLNEERMSDGESALFYSFVKVYVPEGSIGHIYRNPNTEDSIVVEDRYLSANKWHEIYFNATYKGEHSAKIYGDKSLAILKIARCE